VTGRSQEHFVLVYVPARVCMSADSVSVASTWYGENVYWKVRVLPVMDPFSRA
jgi:hypothetical protein